MSATGGYALSPRSVDHVEDGQNSVQDRIDRVQAKKPKNAVKSKKKRAKLTRKILKQQDDWNEWLLSEHKQLQQYEDQGMFSEPTPIPDDGNCLPFI